MKRLSLFAHPTRPFALAVALCGLVLLNHAQAQFARRQSTPPILPDARMTPGDSLPVTAQDICVSGYTKKVRNVPEAVKNQVYANYGIIKRAKGEYEVDHLISLELGGSNSIRNLWPQSYRTKPWNAHVKDVLENRLHALVCKGDMELATAQRTIAANWIEAYKKYVGLQPTGTKTRRTRSTSTNTRTRRARTASTGTKARKKRGSLLARITGQVWVNTHTGIYFQPGSRNYGTTKEGRYMSESDATQAGYRAAGQPKR